MQSVKKNSLSGLLRVVETLRDPEKGCKWDLKQTSKSLEPYIIEEAYELIEALETGDITKITDELGDLLLQIIFQTQFAKEQGHFDIENVIEVATDKMIRRHPHIFGNKKVNKTADEQRTNWEQIKKQERLEKGEKDSPFIKVNKLMPPLNQAIKLQNISSSLGLDFKKYEDVIHKIEEETIEVREAINEKNEIKIKSEIGDLFFSIINLARILEIDPESSIRESNKKFAKRCMKYFKIKNDFEYKNGSLAHFEEDETWEIIKEKEKE